MDYTHLGRSGLTVSRIVLGTMNFGPQTSEADSHAIMDAAREQGINFFDTANRYGGPGHYGHTEEIVGDWFAQGGGRRERTVLATKLYGDMWDGYPNGQKLSALNIRNAIDASLRRLKTEHLDLIQFHHVDRDTPWDEIWQALETAVAQGKVLYVGSSNFAGWHIAQAQEAARSRHFTGLVSEQSIYNLLQRDIEREVIPAAQHYGLGIIPWSPLHGGALAGVIAKQADAARRDTGRSAEAADAHRAQLEAYESFARELGVEPAQLGLAWLLHQPAVTGPIVGPRTMAHLTSAIAALDVALDAAALARLDEIFPGYRTAPEDYAW